MATDEPDTNQLKIRCPKCGQRFKVSPELRNKMVECGACEHRFRINDDVILRTRKFYPGERKKTGLERFARAPVSQPVPVNFETVSYVGDVNPDEFEPPPFQRILSGFVGWILMAMTALGLVLSQGSGGPFGSISTERRMILVGFVALLGSGFAIYSCRTHRTKVILGALAATIGLFTLTWFIPGPEERETIVSTNGTKAAAPNSPGSSGTRTTEKSSEQDRYAALKKEMRYKPVEDEIRATDGNPEHVTAIWLRGMLERYKFSIETYMRRVTDADRSSHMYPRGDTDFLYVLTGINQDIDTTAKYCRRFGKVKEVIHPLRVIEVEVDGTRFIEAPLDRLSNPSDDAFYKLNLDELESIDLKRADRAVERIIKAPPVQYRNDIVRRMISLLDEAPPESLGNIGLALERWSKPEDHAEAAVLKRLHELKQENKEIQEGLVAFLVSRQVKEVQPVLYDLWLKEPDNWELLYARLGPEAEAPIVANLGKKPTMALRASAVRILSRIGAPTAIPALEKLLGINDRTLHTDVLHAIEQIKKRAKEAPDAAPNAKPESSAPSPPDAHAPEKPAGNANSQ